MLINKADNVEINLENGHKYAIRDIKENENIIKYGNPIGHAVCDIKKGEHVHSHNMKTNLGDKLEYEYDPKFFDIPKIESDAVFMGYYYSLGNIYSIAGNLERSVQQTGLIQVREPISSTRFFVLSLLIPVLAHGFFDYALSMGAEGSWEILIVFLIFVIVLYIYCFSKIRNTSLTDVDETQYALYILLKKYPVLKHHVGYIKKE